MDSLPTCLSHLNIHSASGNDNIDLDNLAKMGGSIYKCQSRGIPCNDPLTLTLHPLLTPTRTH